MAVSPSVINKIKWVLFTKEEPPTSGVVWAKPEGDSFIFYAYDNGAWTDIAGTSGVIIPSVSAYLSAFINDAGFLVAADLFNYTTSDDVASAISTALTSYYTYSEVNTLLNGKQDTINDLSEIRSGAAAGATAYQKPLNGIPANDLADDVIPDISGKADKSEMSVVDGTGADADKTTITLKSGTSATVLKSHQSLSGKQDVIDSSHKLSADLVDDTNTTNKFTNATEKQTWNGKQDALTFNTAPSSSNKVATMADVPTTMGASGSGHKGGLVPDTPSTAGTTKFLREDGTWQVPAGDGGDVSGKADKVSGATSGNFAALDSNGNLTDSGHKHSDYLTSHQDISGKEDVTTIVAPVNATDATLPITSLTTEVGKYYRLDVPMETLAVTLPAMTDTPVGKAVVLFLTGGTAPAVTITSTAPSGGTAPAVHFADGFEIKAGKTNEVNCYWNGLAWIVASVEIVISNS